MNTTKSETEVVTMRQINTLAKKIERENFDKCGRSLTVCSMKHGLIGWIVESMDEKGEVLRVKVGWREALRAYGSK